MSEPKKTDFVVENQLEHSLQIKYEVTKRLFFGESEFQKVEIVQTKGLGRMLLIDGLVMAAEIDEFIYHEMIAHVPLFAHPNPKRVLIVGGGDGGTAREVLRHSKVEKCDMVEIDELVVKACREHFPQTASGLTKDSRFQLHIADGVDFVAKAKEKYDLVIVDSTDPIGPAQPLFGKKFYSDVFDCLNGTGIVVSQAESPHSHLEMQQVMSKLLNELFPVVRYYNYTNMTYPVGYWSFSFASKGVHPLRDFPAEKVIDSGQSFQFYNADIHRAAFSLPNFHLDIVGKNLRDGV